MVPCVFDMLWGNDTHATVSGDSHQSFGCTDERFIRARIARIHFLLVTLRRDVTQKKFH